MTSDSAKPVDEQLSALAAYLHARRPVLLQAWRSAVDADPEISAATALPCTQFNDHIPAVLDALERRLRAWPKRESAVARHDRRKDSAAHGLLRWQQGYDLREVTREWSHLGLCLLDELEAYAADHPSLEPGAMPVVRRIVAELCGDGVCESTSQHFELQQIEAEGHLRDLEDSLGQARELERQRAELWRQAAHDLRGNVGVVVTATAGLTLEGLPEPMRERFLGSLQTSVSALQAMLDEVVDLTRLQAGHEHREVKPFDAAQLLLQLVEAMQGLADQRGLFLRGEGPAALPIEGDAGKTRRIAQNLLLNALKYTPQGGVTVSWGDSRADDAERWVLSVGDTGPGLHTGPAAPLADALEEATHAAQRVEAAAARPPNDAGAGASTPESQPSGAPARRGLPGWGEGIGLSIVKRLCEMLDATFELESVPGQGTTVRVVLPRQYVEPSPRTR